MSSLVSIRNLRKTYQRGAERVEVLHGIDLEIPEGDFVALMGPSGSGKTTLLNLIGGLDTPSGGEVEIAGQRIDSMGAGQLSTWRSNHVGFVFQFYNLMPTLNAQKNVELPLLLTRLNAAQRRRNAEIALQLVGLARPPHWIRLPDVQPAPRPDSRSQCGVAPAADEALESGAAQTRGRRAVGGRPW